MSAELDAKVEELVFGKEPSTWFHPTTKADHDYMVLQYVREHWAGSENRAHWEMLDAFEEELLELRRHRPLWDSIAYEVGDYSKAALTAVGFVLPKDHGLDSDDPETKPLHESEMGC